MLKPFLGPQEWPSRLATSPIAPIRSVPPVLGWAAPALAGVGCPALAAAPAAVGAPAAGLAGLVVGDAAGVGAPHALSSVAADAVNASINARRRLSRFASNCIPELPRGLSPNSLTRDRI